VWYYKESDDAATGPTDNTKAVTVNEQTARLRIALGRPHLRRFVAAYI
jgi:hypothetical protein